MLDSKIYLYYYIQFFSRLSETVIEFFFRFGFELTDLQKKNLMWTGFKKRQKYAVFESLENLKNGNYYSL